MDEVNRNRYITMTAKVVTINKGIYCIVIESNFVKSCMEKVQPKFKLLYTKRKISKQHYTVRGLNEEQARLKKKTIHVFMQTHGKDRLFFFHFFFPTAAYVSK